MTTQNCVWGHICPLSMRLADVSKPTGGLLAAGTLVSLSFHHKQGLNPRQTPSRGDLDRTQPVEPLGQWAVALGLVSWKGPTLQPARQLAPHCHHPRIKLTALPPHQSPWCCCHIWPSWCEVFQLTSWPAIHWAVHLCTPSPTSIASRARLRNLGSSVRGGC